MTMSVVSVRGLETREAIAAPSVSSMILYAIVLSLMVLSLDSPLRYLPVINGFIRCKQNHI
jgi:hypothetical protein